MPNRFHLNGHIAGFSSHTEKLEEHCMFPLFTVGLWKSYKWSSSVPEVAKVIARKFYPRKAAIGVGCVLSCFVLLFCFWVLLYRSSYVFLWRHHLAPKKNSPQLQQQEVLLETFIPKMAPGGFFFRSVYALLCHNSPSSFANTIPNPFEYCGLAQTSLSATRLITKANKIFWADAVRTRQNLLSNLKDGVTKSMERFRTC